MRSRTRVLAALLALFAFTAAFAEQVWASTCAPETRVSAPAHATHAAPAAHATGGCDDAPMPAHRQHAPSRAPAGGGECPFQAVAAGGCVLFSFPAPVTAAPVLAAAGAARQLPAAEAAPDLLLAQPRFRPPQA